MTMQALFMQSGVSRQAFHKALYPSEYALNITPAEQVLQVVRLIRKDDLPGTGARYLFRYMQENVKYASVLTGWGKHRFEQLCLGDGLRLVKPKNFIRTTKPGNVRFPNLIEGLTINNIDQVWASDISYVFYKREFLGYTTTVLDIYSRYLLALIFSTTMRAVDTVIPALQMAMQVRGKNKFPGLIFHSDRGSQYGADKFLEIVNGAEMSSSMAKNALENAFAERINDTIKNAYFLNWGVNSRSQLTLAVPKLLHSYNSIRPHQHLDHKTPLAFEQYIATLQDHLRPPLKIKLIT